VDRLKGPLGPQIVRGAVLQGIENLIDDLTEFARSVASHVEEEWDLG
jgi:hypothetical protein